MAVLLRAVLLGVALLHAGSAWASELSREEVALLRKMVREGKGSEAVRVIEGGKTASRPAVDRVAAAPLRGTAGDAPSAKAPTESDYLYLLQKNQPGAPAEYSPCAGLIALLRKDWKDIGLLSCPDTTEKATGAEVSYADDRVARNATWSLHGTTGLFYSSTWENSQTRLDLFHTSFGVYGSFDKVFNSLPSKSDADRTSYGGAVEFGLHDPPSGFDHYFRIRGGGVQDGVKHVDSAGLTLEYIPEQPDYLVHYPFQPRVGDADFPFILRIDPTMLAQYNGVTNGRSAILPNGRPVLDFNGRAEAFRIGPQVALRMFPVPGMGVLSNVNGTVSYHVAEEVYSGKQVRWFDASLTYNLDPLGHLGLTFGYQRGRDEDSGTRTNLFTAALTGKI